MPEKKEVVVIKLGGSSLDAEFEDWDNKYLEKLKPHIYKLSKNYSPIIVPGGGPAWDPRKRWRIKYNTSIKLFRKLGEDILRHNALEIAEVLGEKAIFVGPNKFESMDAKFLSNNIAVMYVCPKKIVEKLQFAPEYSDTQTLAIAETFGAKTAIFIKRANGIKRWDSLLTQEKIETLLKTELTVEVRKQLNHILAQIKSGVENTQFHYVKASSLQGDPPEICTVGEDAQDNHLIEQPAVDFFLNKAKKLERIGVMNIAKPKLLLGILKDKDYKKGFSYIIKE